MAERLFETADAGFENGSPWEDKHFYHTLEAVNSVIFTASIDENEEEKNSRFINCFSGADGS